MRIKGANNHEEHVPVAHRVTSKQRARLDSAAYEQLIGKVRHVANKVLAASARGLVVSKGDEELLKIPGRGAGHFPQMDNGTYAGHYPADSAAAIGHLEALIKKGAEFLPFPQTSFWWLSHYDAFHQHLRRHHECIFRDDACIIFGLSDSVRIPAHGSARRAADTLADARFGQLSEREPARPPRP